MKHLAVFLGTALSVVFLTLSSCEKSGLTDEQISEGLKEALTVGTDTSVAKVAKEDGYNEHPLKRILFPPEADVVVDVVSALPGGTELIAAAEVKMNRAAEQAAEQAVPIFVDAITQITIEDVWGILNGHDSAATKYLEDKTRANLYSGFKPEIETALAAVGAQQAFDEVMTLYNSIPFVTQVNTDLADHTTNKALNGLFYEVQQEEHRIRVDPAHRVTEILEEVFAEQD